MTETSAPHAFDDAALLKQRGLAALGHGHFEAALLLLEDAALTLAGDYRLELGLADCLQGLNRPADAIPHLRRAVAAQPFKHDLRLRFGRLLLANHCPEEALAVVETLLSVSPDQADALMQRGVALLNLHRYVDAIEPLSRASGLLKEAAEPVFLLGQALRQAGQSDAAIEAFREAVRRDPQDGAAQAILGELLFACGERQAALDTMRQAVRLAPDDLSVVMKVGEIEQAFAHFDQAIPLFRQALVLHARQPHAGPPPYRLLGNALWQSGDKAGALDVMRDGIAAASWMRGQRAPIRAAAAGAQPLQIACWCGMGRSNTPTEYILDPDHQAVETVFLVQGVDYPAKPISQAFDVVFNSISDADAAPDALRVAAALAQEMRIPVLNQPALMEGTMRHRTGPALAGIPKLHLPRTERYGRADLIADPSLVDGFAYPVIIRPAGGHFGVGMVRVEDQGALIDAARTMAEEFVYVIAFHDFVSSDGLYRKLRLIFVDGRVYPLHLSIGDHWLNHYVNTRTAAEEALKTEEIAFLEQPEAYLGAAIYRAAQAVPKRIGLDFFGLDGAIDANGDLVVFECNATMRVRHRDNRAIIDHKREAAEAVKNAVLAMLRKAAFGENQRINR